MAFAFIAASAGFRTLHAITFPHRAEELLHCLHASEFFKCVTDNRQAVVALDDRFLGLNHIRRPRRACRTKCG
jgi:hypothetical protein